MIVYLAGGGIALALLFFLLLLLGGRSRPGRFVEAVAREPGVRKQVVVIGGGFGGIYAAQELERLAAGHDDLEVTLISRDNYFVFQPMLPEVISGTIGITDTVSPIRTLLPRTHVMVREVTDIDLAARTVTVAPGFMPRPRTVPFDHLVLALGTVTDFRGLRGLPEHAMPFKNLADALALRNHVIRALEEAAVEHENAALRKRLLTFVVAGGGFSGVEVAAELNDFVQRAARHYRGIDPAELRVILLHGRERILPEVAAKLALFAQDKLKKRGVEIRLNTRLVAASASAALLQGGERIETETLVSTIPSSPHPLVERLGLPKSGGRITVDAQCQVEGHPGVWALGDCAAVPSPDGGTCPPTAQHAIRQGRTLARNLAATVRGGRLQPFAFRGLGKMGSLGYHSAVAEVLGFHLSGLLAWWMWRAIYLAKLPGLGRRIKVATAWTLDMFLEPELVQLGLDGGAGIRQEHFEAGDVVFREGDAGDRIFVILVGQAEVVREVGGGEQHLGKLGPGEYFGEMALLQETVRTATVRCATGLDAVSIPKREFGLLAGSLPDLRRSFEEVARRRAHSLPQVPAAAAPRRERPPA